MKNAEKNGHRRQAYAEAELRFEVSSRLRVAEIDSQKSRRVATPDYCCGRSLRTEQHAWTGRRLCTAGHPRAAAGEFVPRISPEFRTISPKPRPARHPSPLLSPGTVPN